MAKKLQIGFLGDSLTYGVGTIGTGSSGSGVIGNYTFAKQTVRIAKTLIGSTFFTRGYPGEDAASQMGAHLTDFLAQFSAGYDLQIAVIFFGTNDLNHKSPAQTYTDIVSLNNAIRTNGRKTIVVPCMNRTDTYTTATFNADRLALYSLLRNDTVNFDGFADLALESHIWPSTATSDAVYCRQGDADGLSGVHWTEWGAQCIAKQIAVAIERIGS